MKAAPLLEHRALEYLDALRNGHPPAASVGQATHFAAWPGSPAQAARLLAAHANAARGQEVLWLVGVRTGAGGKLALPGADAGRFEAWLHGLLPYFDGLAPVVRAFAVGTGAKRATPARQVVALQIDSTRAPFVVRAQAASKTFDVPWWERESGQTRSAGRHELIRLLVPMQDLPQCEVLEAELTFYKNFHSAGSSKITHRWTLDGSLYVIPHQDNRAIIPLHRCRAGIAAPDAGFHAPASDLTLTADKQSPAVRVTESAALVEGLGRVFVYCSGATTAAELPLQLPLTLTFDLLPAGAERAVVATAALRPAIVTEANQVGRWKL